ncbi:MAG TPA: hypothetical protein VHB18_11760 [Mycobacteriales bacterium]|jgi:hypothetical protein|nr:hypothetical protein [Mycobacteriales bacterium]
MSKTERIRAAVVTWIANRVKGRSDPPPQFTLGEVRLAMLVVGLFAAFFWFVFRGSLINALIAAALFLALGLGLFVTRTRR